MAAVDIELSALGQEKRKLRKSLFRFDMVLFTVCAIVGLDTLGQSAQFGAQAVFWLIVSGVTFLIPCGLLVSELGTAFPLEGATYEWVRLAFGPLAGAVTIVLYWLSTPIWLGGTLVATSIAALDALWGTRLASSLPLEVLVATVCIWLAVLANVLSLRQMKWVPNWGAMVKLALLALFAVLVVVAGFHHGFAGSLTSGFFPSNVGVFTGVIGVLIFQYVGFELQTNASEEMDNPQRDVPRAIIRAGALVVIGYTVPIAATVLTLSSHDVSNVSGFVAGYQSVVATVFGPAARWINYAVGALVAFAIIASGATWLIGSDRAIAIGSLAGSGPRSFGIFSQRFGTPVVVNVYSGIVATITMLATLLITGGDLRGFFAVVLGVIITTSTFCYILVYPSLIALRRRFPDRARPYRLPGGMVGAWIVVLICETYVVSATVFSLWPNICDASGCFGAAALAPVSGLSRGRFELASLGSVAVILLLGVVFWMIGRARTRRMAEAEAVQPAEA